MVDRIRLEIRAALRTAKEPLETKEIVQRVRKRLKNATRTKILYRLHLLRAEQQVKGKQVGPSKGVWIWWKN